MFRNSTAIFVWHATIASPSMLLSTRNNKICSLAPVTSYMQQSCINQSVNQQVRQAVNESIRQLINPSVSQSISQTINQPIVSPLLKVQLVLLPAIDKR